MVELVALAFLVAGAIALVGWWNGPDIPRH
jgi:hypothetical protein